MSTREVQCWRGERTGQLVFTPFINLPNNPNEKWRVHYVEMDDPTAVTAIRMLQDECGRLCNRVGELEEEVDSYV